MTKEPPDYSTPPSPQPHSSRLARLNEIISRLHSIYQDRILAIALYGSLARGEDGPYSDIELFCVVDQPGLEIDYEWVYGKGKAEVNVLGPDIARQQAARVDWKWAFYAGQFANARLIEGNAAILEELRTIALSPASNQAQKEIESMLVGEFYEWIGKLRNARQASRFSSIPMLACEFTQTLAMLLGLDARRPYTTSAHFLEESLTLPGLPAGYPALCELVMSGDLSDPVRLSAGLETCWESFLAWCAERGIEIKPSDWPGVVG